MPRNSAADPEFPRGDANGEPQRERALTCYSEQNCRNCRSTTGAYQNDFSRNTQSWQYWHFYSAALPKIKYICTVLFLRQMYSSFTYTAKYSFSQTTIVKLKSETWETLANDMNFLMFLQGGYEFAYFCRPQTKFTKVMFSQVFVCPFVCLRGSLCRGSLCRGVPVQGGLCPRVSVQGGLYPGRSLSMGVSVHGVSVGGLCARGSLCKGISVQGGLCPGISVQGGLCPGVCPGESLSRGVSVRETSHTVTCGQYVSYWNAFLYTVIFSGTKDVYHCSTQSHPGYHQVDGKERRAGDGCGYSGCAAPLKGNSKDSSSSSSQLQSLQFITISFLTVFNTFIHHLVRH